LAIDNLSTSGREKKLNTIGFATASNEGPENGPDVGKMYRQELANTANQKRTKKERLLANPDVKRWHSNLSRRSKNTAEVRLRRLGRFCEEHQTTPMQIIDIAMKDDKGIADLLQDHITMMEERGNAGGYIKTTMTALKSWLEHFGIVVKRHLMISNVNATKTLKNEKIPNVEDLTEIFTGATLRQGTIMSVIAKSGLRPQVLGNIDGSDGLKIMDLCDLGFVNGKWCFLNQPPRVIVREALSKANHEYFSFLTEIAQTWILAYLNDRTAKGEAVTPDTPVVNHLNHSPFYREQKKGRKFMTTSMVCRDVREAMRPKFRQRPYVLRSYFRTQLLIAEAKGKVSHEYAEFWFGHVGDMSARYTTNKGILPEQLLSSMKESFLKCQEFLDLEKNVEKQKDEKTKIKVKETVENLSGDELTSVLEYVRKLHTARQR